MASPASDIGMKYRFLGDSGLLVSEFGFGCLVVDDKDTDQAYDVMAHAFKHGVNFFDTAESYGNGGSERVTGSVLHRGIEDKVWTREDLVISTKLYFGTKQGPNATGLSRKHVIEGAKASLQRLRTDYVDVLFCHRPEKSTPIEEVVRAMNFVVNQGWALYWGTSEWHESDIPHIAPTLEPSVDTSTTYSGNVRKHSYCGLLFATCGATSASGRPQIQQLTVLSSGPSSVSSCPPYRLVRGNYHRWPSSPQTTIELPLLCTRRFELHGNSMC